MNHKIEYAQGRDLDKMKNFNRPRQQIKPHPASKVHWEITKKSGIMNSGLDGMPLLLLDDLLINYLGRQPRRLLRPRQHFLRKSSVSFQRAAQPRPSCVSPKATGSSDLYSPSHSISEKKN